MEKVLIELNVERQRELLGHEGRSMDSGFRKPFKKSHRQRYKMYTKGSGGVGKTAEG